MNNEELLKNIVKWIEEKKGKDITIVDMDRDITVDSFIIASAGSLPHLEALSEIVRKNLKQLSISCKIDGIVESEWIVIDIGAYMVHLFTDRMRRIYKIEELGKIR